MKKALLICGIILVIAALICLCISFFYNHLGGAVLDASGDFYHRVYQRYSLFLKIGIGVLIAGIIAIAASLLFFRGENKAIYNGKLISFSYNPGYSDMRGASHNETLNQDDKGTWVIVCSDREDINEAMTITSYSVAEEDLKNFEAFLEEKDIVSLAARKESDEFATDYSPWSYTIVLDCSSTGGSKYESVSITEFRQYTDSDRDLLKELTQRFRALRGRKISH